MFMIRKARERGSVNLGWLDSQHSFSFGQYQDPNHMGFRDLRVINEDRVTPGAGFQEHGHQNMEIISYVLDGALEHKDSIGTGSIIRPGEVQRMSAGSGIRHSEFNHSKEASVHFLQIWVLPDQDNITPGYEQKAFGAERHGTLRLVASKEGRDGSLTIHQSTDIYASILQTDETVRHHFQNNRHGWLQVARGGLEVEGQILQAGDGLAMSKVDSLEIKALTESEFLLFDLA